MSQSATWDALRLAADFRAWDRDEDAARVMPDPEVAWVKCTASMRYPKFILDEHEDSYETRRAAGEQVRSHRVRYDWMCHGIPAGWIKTGRWSPYWGVDRSVDPGPTWQRRSEWSSHGPSLFARMQERINRSAPRDGFVFTLGDTNGQQYQQVWSDEAVDAYPGILRSSMPRRNLTAALTALPGYRALGYRYRNG